MFFYQSLACFLSFELAFLANALILLASFKNYKSLILKTKLDFTPPRPAVCKYKRQKIIRFFKGPSQKRSPRVMMAFFSLGKVLSYVFLILVFLWLENHGFLRIIPLLLGLFVLPFSSLIQLVRK